MLFRSLPWQCSAVLGPDSSWPSQVGTRIPVTMATPHPECIPHNPPRLAGTAAISPALLVAFPIGDKNNIIQLFCQVHIEFLTCSAF